MANARLTAAAAIVGTISDTNLDTWVLDRAPIGSSTFTTLASGTAPVSSATLATFDPTVLANGPYVLRLTATDIAGRVSQTTIVVEADSTTKPAQYLRTETDLSVVLAGSVFNLVRTYDSLTADQSGTFGYGWRLAVEDTDIQTTVLPTGQESTGIYNPFLIGTRVYLTLPTGQRVGFTFTPVKEQINGLTYYMPAYTADSGVTYTLSSAGGPLIQAGNRYYDLKTGLAYNPAADLYAGPEYVLTAPDGTAYDLSTAQGVQEMIRPDGTRLYFSDSGITASTGESIQFVHDAQGRITSIIAPDGTRVIYTYDSSGNLVSARNLVSGQSSRYGYQAGPIHLLIEAVSPANGTSAVVQYAPSFQVLPLTADLGSSGEFLASNQTGTLAAGGTDRYAFSFRPSELLSTASGEIYLGITVQATSGSALQPGVPLIVGLTPLVSHTSALGSFALYAIGEAGLELLDVSGANGATKGSYTLHMFVAGDVNGDGKVDGTDGQLLAGALGTSVGQPGYLAAADANQDGVINATDMQLLSSDLGFQENLPPVSTAGQATTHIDLAVTVDLATLATDPEGNPIYFRVLNPEDGTATLSPDGHTVTFVPAPGYTGPASFQYVADDGYGTSATATVSINVSAAPLVSLDFEDRAPSLQPGDSLNVTVVGDFADENGAVLPSSYLTFQTLDLSVATISAGGQLHAVADGTTVLLVSSHGIQAATAVSVGTSTDQTQQLLVKLGLDDYPQALSLAAHVGSRQLKIDVGGEIDLTSASTGTEYFVSNPNVVTVTPDGLVNAGNVGIAQITVINGPAEQVIPVEVELPQSGSIQVGPAGAIVQGSDGSTVAVPPGAMGQGATVDIQPVAQADLPMSLPAALDFAGAFQLDLGNEQLADPVQIAVPVAPGIAAGTPVLFYRADQIPDGSGSMVPAWMEVEDGVVGSDGFARSASPPYDGIREGGTYIAAIVNTLESGLVSGYLEADAGFALGGSSFMVLDTQGAWANVGAYVDLLSHFVIQLPTGSDSVNIVEVPQDGQSALATQVKIDVAQTGVTQYTASVPTSTITNGPPQISDAGLASAPGGGYQLVLDGQGFGNTLNQISVLFQVGGRDLPGQAEGGQDSVAQPTSVTDNTITVNVPAGVPLGSAQITVIRQIPNGTGQPITLESDPIPFETRDAYVLTAQNAAGSVAILDGQATVPDSQNPGQQIPNPDYGNLVTTINVGADRGRPTSRSPTTTPGLTSSLLEVIPSR